MRAIGGYFSLEVNEGIPWHQTALPLNAGRYALEYILKARRYRKIYVPYYICDSVLQPVIRLGVKYDFYHINEHFEPVVELTSQEDEAILYVNYFGLKNRYINTFSLACRNIILDQTQAFYSEPVYKNGDTSTIIDSFYSCRKFFGVPDGAYLYTDCKLDADIPQDESFERITFLAKRIDRSPQEGYAEFHANDKLLGTVGMKRMSKLTEKMMRGIDYTSKANTRVRNFRILNNVLRSTNRLKWDLDNNTVPLVYPYYIDNGAQLRKHLIDHQVFCARYWPNVLEWCNQNDWEYQLTENLVCIPIDQRYNDADMNRILFLLSCL